MVGFGPTGYSDYQNGLEFETACEDPNNIFWSSGNKALQI